MRSCCCSDACPRFFHIVLRSIGKPSAFFVANRCCPYYHNSIYLILIASRAGQGDQLRERCQGIWSHLTANCYTFRKWHWKCSHYILCPQLSAAFLRVSCALRQATLPIRSHGAYRIGCQLTTSSWSHCADVCMVYNVECTCCKKCR